MRLARLIHEGRARTGLVANDGASLLLLQGGDDLVDGYVRGQHDDIQALIDDRKPVAMDQVRLLAPIKRFSRDILCVGWNYKDHFYESQGRREGQDPDELPTHPTFFGKSPTTAIGARDDIALDERVSENWDYEAELAVVIGRGGRSIPERLALDHIAGYCIANDVSQRDVQRRHGGQWLKGKSIDRTMPIGPWLTTPDEVQIATLIVECRLNGQLVQQAPASDMIFSIPRIIAELSLGMTLSPGDTILTGTPSGIGNARTPPLFLQPGDELTTSISGLGALVNHVATSPLADYEPNGVLRAESAAR